MSTSPRYWICSLIAIIGTVAISEGFAYWWMHPAKDTKVVQVLGFSKPPEETSWKESPAIYSKVQKSLKCSAGSTGDFETESGKIVHLAYIEWNPDGNGAPIEAFTHLPEACMGSIGMKLESIDAPRTHLLADGINRIIFDATVFRKPASIQRVFVFKGIWIEGLNEANLREGAFGGNYQKLRTYRIEAAKRRFLPDYSRVVMGAIEGAVTSDEAWELFSSKVLGRLRLQDVTL